MYRGYGQMTPEGYMTGERNGGGELEDYAAPPDTLAPSPNGIKGGFVLGLVALVAIGSVALVMMTNKGK